MHVTFVSGRLSDVDLNDMTKVKDKSELFSVSGNQIYIFCPNRYGKSKLNNAFFEKKLKVTATTRNWNTVSALNDIANST